MGPPRHSLDTLRPLNEEELQEWEEAYAAVEAYLQALRLRNRLLVAELVRGILWRASARRADEPDKPARLLAMEEALSEVAEWTQDVLDVPLENRRPVNVPAAYDGYELLDALTAIFPQISREEWEARCEAGRFVNYGGTVRGKTHVVRGGDYGWRTSYQHMKGFGPWVSEEMWRGGLDGILPPAGTVFVAPTTVRTVQTPRRATTLLRIPIGCLQRRTTR